MISIIETSAQVCNIFFIWYFKSTTITNLIIGMILFDIILPHAFLMNTSQNKNRIVELGWKNILKNIVGIFNNSVVNSESTATENKGIRNSVIEKEDTEQNRKISNTSGDKIVSISSHSLRVKNPKDSAISKVSFNGEYSGYKKSDAERPNISTLNAKALDVRAHTHKISQTLISEMIESRTDERRYMIYFKKFAAFQESRKRGKIISSIELEDQFLPDIEKSKKYTRNNLRVKGTHNKSKVSQIAVLEQEVNTFNKEETFKSNDRHLKLKGKLDERVLLRRDILREISSLVFAEHNERYDTLIEILIDLEEGFVMDC
jgi:hypothetical protein